MDGKRSARHTRGLAIAIVGCAIALAACGSSTKHPSGASSQLSLVRFSQCVRASGLPDFPDLSSSRMLIGANGQSVSVNGVSVNAQAFETARLKCQKYLPAPIVASSPQQTQALSRTLHFARCMRSHGVPNFPDPKVTRGEDGNRVVDLRGAGLNFHAPAFLVATKACGGGPKGP